MLRKQLGRGRLVIATDGALPPEPEQIQLWQQLGCIVWLQAEADTIFRRMRRKKNRIFLPRQATAETVQQLAAERAPLYAGVADFAINVDCWALEQVVCKILAFGRGLCIRKRQICKKILKLMNSAAPKAARQSSRAAKSPDISHAVIITVIIRENAI